MRLLTSTAGGLSIILDSEHFEKCNWLLVQLDHLSLLLKSKNKRMPFIWLWCLWFFFCFCNLLWTCPCFFTALAQTQVHSWHLCVSHSGPVFLCEPWRIAVEPPGNTTKQPVWMAEWFSVNLIPQGNRKTIREVFFLILSRGVKKMTQLLKKH